MLIDLKPQVPWYNEYGPILDGVPFINNLMRVDYQYNEIDQLLYEFGYEYEGNIGWGGSPYEIYYDYDADGNMVEKTLYKGWANWPGTSQAEKVTTYIYDAEDRLASITFPKNQTNTFYDCFCGAKQMEYTDANGEVTRYFLDGDQVLYEYDGNNQIKTRYTNGPGIDEKISVTYYNPGGKETTYYYHYDGLGSVPALTDESDKLVETYNYDPFGVIIDHDRNVTKNLYAYTGRNYIPDAGIYYYRNRYYDPRVGRFTTKDPSGMPDSVNRYTYVNNNPVNKIDPSGLAWWLITGRAGDPSATEGWIPEAKSRYNISDNRAFNWSVGPAFIAKKIAKECEDATVIGHSLGGQVSLIISHYLSSSTHFLDKYRLHLNLLDPVGPFPDPINKIPGNPNVSAYNIFTDWHLSTGKITGRLGSGLVTNVGPWHATGHEHSLLEITDLYNHTHVPCYWLGIKLDICGPCKIHDYH